MSADDAGITAPDCTTSHATANEPSRLPINDHAKSAATCVQVTRFASAPITATILLPVNSSDPAKITSVNAMPKETPITSFKAAEPSAAKGPPTLKINVIPKPRYAPANAARMK